MKRTHIIYYEWSNLKGNHAGMVHLIKEFKKKYEKQVRLVEVPNKINHWGHKIKKVYLYFLLLKFKICLKQGDNILFLEYLGNNSGNQTEIAIQLRNWNIKNKLIGLVNLSKTNLLELYGSEDYIYKGASVLDKILVLGSSLESYFVELGYKDKIVKTFHYVDSNFYKPKSIEKLKKSKVVHIGSIKRNFLKLREIVIQCPEIQFSICQGHQNLSEYFQGLKNVTLYGFLTEESLRELMQSCDISLSILDDTIGSNVITTSMACGLVNVVSEVGSIRDYCNDQDSFLCKSNEEFIEKLNHLANNPDTLLKMRQASFEKSKELSLEKSISVFNYLLNK